MTPLELVALQAQYTLILSTLESTKYNMSRTALILEIDRKTLYNKISKFKKHKKAIEASAST
jgi:two-component system, NtrC family, response regulator HydG